MGRTQKEIAEVGAIRIALVAFGIFRENARTLIPIQLAFGLPCFVLQIALRYIRVLYRPPVTPEPYADPMAAVTEMFSHSGGQMMQDIVLIMLETMIIKCLEALSCSANIYAVGLVYTDNIVSFSAVLKASLKGLWKRLAVTLIYLQSLSAASIFGFSGLAFLVIYFQFDPAWILIPSLAMVVVSFYISAITMVAAGVSVLDEIYGWAALKKARKLLKGKLWVALRFKLLLAVIVGAVGFIWAGNEARIIANPWDVKLYLWTVAEIACLAFLGQMISLCNGVAYVSFKAHHGEGLPGSSLVEDGSKEYLELEEGLVK